MAAVVGSLCGISCGAIYGGVKHGVLSWTLNATGLAQSLIKQSAPTFQAAFYYGACSGMARYVVKHVSQESQKASRIERYSVLYMINALTIATEILTRYGAAYVLTTQAGIRIDMKYVHITAAWAAMTAPCCTISGRTLPIYLHNNPEEAARQMQQAMQGLQAFQRLFGGNLGEGFGNMDDVQDLDGFRAHLRQGLGI